MSERMIEMVMRRDGESREDATDTVKSTIEEAKIFIDENDMSGLEDLLIGDGFDLDYMEDVLEDVAGSVVNG